MGRPSTRGAALHQRHGPGYDPGAGDAPGLWPGQLYLAAGDTGELVGLGEGLVNTPELGAVSRPTATWFMAPRVTPLVRPSR
jgi:hypothetical protein